MSDTMTVQVICPLTKLPYSCEGVNHEVCPGGKEITLRRVEGKPIGRRTLYDFYEDGSVWVVEVSGG